MTIAEIKAAVDAGHTVKWSNNLYDVKRKKSNSSHNGYEYLIVCSSNGHTIGLHGMEGTKYENHLNGDPDEFYIKTDPDTELDANSVAQWLERKFRSQNDS